MLHLLDATNGTVPTSQECLLAGTRSKPSSITSKLSKLASQLQEFLDGMNENMRCRTEGCSGKYVPIKMVCDGLGGAIVIEIACDGCQLMSWLFCSSPTIEGSQCTLVSLDLTLSIRKLI